MFGEISYAPAWGVAIRLPFWTALLASPRLSTPGGGNIHTKATNPSIRCRSSAHHPHRRIVFGIRRRVVSEDQQP